MIDNDLMNTMILMERRIEEIKVHQTITLNHSSRQLQMSSFLHHKFDNFKMSSFFANKLDK